jgi:hypothetical protein
VIYLLIILPASGFVRLTERRLARSGASTAG